MQKQSLLAVGQEATVAAVGVVAVRVANKRYDFEVAKREFQEGLTYGNNMSR